MNRLSHFLVLFGLVTFVTGLASCERDDDEPTPPVRPISRLYVSTSEYQVNSNLPRFDNVFVVDPADGDEFSRITTRFNSNAIGGNLILYHPEFRHVFHSSINRPDVTNLEDTTVRVLSVDRQTGMLGLRGTITSDQLNAIRGMDYHGFSQQALFVNADGMASHIFVYPRPESLSRPTPPRFRMPITGLGEGLLPTALMVHDVNLDENSMENIVYLTTAVLEDEVAEAQIVGYKNLIQRFVGDTVINNVVPDFVLTIPEAKNLNDIAYSPLLDLLVAVDYNNNRGRILFFDNFSAQTSTGTLTPNRVIEGAATLLKTPRAVEIDKRENASYLYVADSEDKSVLRFRIDAEGNVEPNARLEILGGTRTPMGISLDARGTILVEEEQ